MREQYQINDFSKGIITIADSADIPDEACVYSENADPSEGLLTPVKMPSTVSGTGTVPSNAKQTAFAIKDSDSTGLLYTCTESTNYKVKLIDEYSSAFSSTAVELSSGTTGEYQVSQLIARDKEIRLPRGTSYKSKIFKYNTYIYNDFTGVVELSDNPSIAGTGGSENLHFTGTMHYDRLDLVSYYDRTSYAWFNITACMEEDLGYSSGYLLLEYDNPYGIDMFKIGDKIFTDEDGTERTVVYTGHRILGDLYYIVVDVLWGGQSPSILYFKTPVGIGNRIRFLVKVNQVDTSLLDLPSLTIDATYQTIDGYNAKARLGNLDSDDFVRGKIFTLRKSTYIYEDNDLSSHTATIELETPIENSGTGYFKTTNKYFYKYSVIYDGFQESVLASTVGNANYLVPSVECVTLDVDMYIPLNYTTSFTQRITGINLYRGESSDISKTEPEGYYRIVKSWDFTEEFLTANWDDTTQKIKLRHTDYGNWAGSYESITGISESLSTITPNYTYGIYSGNRLYTIGNYIADEPEAARMLLMSQPFKYDTFNWDLDYVMLDSMPKGIGEFRGTIFVFGKNVIWKINPDNLNIDQFFTGYDLLDQNSILTTEYGLLFCTTNGVYIIDTTGINELSYPIANKDGVNSGITTAVSWKEFYHSNIRLYIYFDEGKKSFIIYDAYKEAALVYYIPKKAWWYWKFATSATNTTSCLFFDSSQNVFYSNGTNLKKFYGGNYATLTWISKLITLGNYRQKKRLQKIKYKGDGTLVYGLDNVAPTSSVTNEDGAVTYAYFNTIQLKLTLSTGSNKLIFKAVEMLYRAMKGLR